MTKNLVFLAAGIVIGAVVTMSILSGNEDLSKLPKSELSATGQGTLPADERTKSEAMAERDAVETQPESASVPKQLAAEATAEHDLSIDEVVPASSREERLVDANFELSEPYASLVKSPTRANTLSTPELYERFLSDGRDNAWADAMEAGMNLFEAEKGVTHKTAFEAVECRSRYCIIAGVSYSTEPQPWNPIMTELSTSGWWQGSGGTSISATSNGNETRFISIISRERVDTVRDAGAQTVKGKDSGVRGA